MQNIRRETYRNARTPMRDPIAAGLHAGWTDYRAGKAFDADYDRWTTAHQINYENGRRLAAVVAAGGPVPSWARNQLCPVNKSLYLVCHPAWSAEVKYIHDTSALAA
jgi:hypothetical protein